MHKYLSTDKVFCFQLILMFHFQGNEGKRKTSYGKENSQEAQQVNQIELLLDLEKLVHFLIFTHRPNTPTASEISPRLLKHFVVFYYPCMDLDDQCSVLKRSLRMQLSGNLLNSFDEQKIVLFPDYFPIIYSCINLIYSLQEEYF